MRPACRHYTVLKLRGGRKVRAGGSGTPDAGAFGTVRSGMQGPQGPCLFVPPVVARLRGLHARLNADRLGTTTNLRITQSRMGLEFCQP